MTNDFLKIAARILPRRIKDRLKRWREFQDWRAGRLAAGSKRLDLTAAQTAHALHLMGLAGKNYFQDKVVLEIGSGWVLSHALVFYLLGARQVIATDIEAHASFKSLGAAIHGSTLSAALEFLSPFEDHHLIRRRVADLFKQPEITEEVLQNIGISYVAPIDLARQELPVRPDFIYSYSVLEHVPIDDLRALVNNLLGALSQEGLMFHHIHLEDHRDIDYAPFAFLDKPESGFDKQQQSRRGNRLRASGWRRLFMGLDQADFEFLYSWRREGFSLPERIDPSVSYEDENDLRISHIGVTLRRR